MTAIFAELSAAVAALPSDRRHLLMDSLAMASKSLPDALRDAIRDSGETHYSIAQAANVAPAQLDRFMNGERDITLETAGRIATALGLQLAPIPGKPGTSGRRRRVR